MPYTPRNENTEHTHRYTSYIKDLERNWAYKNTNKTPRSIYASHITQTQTR